MSAEHDGNWLGADEEINESYLPNSANFVSSHAIFKVKIMDDRGPNLKGRMVCGTR